MFKRSLIWVVLATLTIFACRGMNVSNVHPPPVQTEAPASITQAVQSSAPSPAHPTARVNRVQKDITYCTVDGIELKMDVYYPQDTSGTTPLVVYVHGGGWSGGSKEGEAGLADASTLLNAGFTVASLDYRLAPQYKFPAMIEDVKCAIRSFRAHAAEYHINPDQIGVWGGSAGGHLVSMLGTTDTSAGFDVGEYLDQSSRVQAVVDMFGPADLTTGFSAAYLNLRDGVFGTFDLALASPVTYITSDDPPFLILQGDVDKTVPLSQSQEFYDKLTAAGVDAQLVIVKGGNHGLNDPYENPSRDELGNLIVQFFTEKLK